MLRENQLKNLNVKSEYDEVKVIQTEELISDKRVEYLKSFQNVELAKNEKFDLPLQEVDKPNINVQESEKNCKTYCYLVINDSVETSHNRKFDKKRSQTELKNIIIMNNYNKLIYLKILILLFS